MMLFDVRGVWPVSLNWSNMGYSVHVFVSNPPPMCSPTFSTSWVGWGFFISSDKVMHVCRCVSNYCWVSQGWIAQHICSPVPPPTPVMYLGGGLSLTFPQLHLQTYHPPHPPHAGPSPYIYNCVRCAWPSPFGKNVKGKNCLRDQLLLHIPDPAQMLISGPICDPNIRSVQPSVVQRPPSCGPWDVTLETCGGWYVCEIERSFDKWRKARFVVKVYVSECGKA